MSSSKAKVARAFLPSDGRIAVLLLVAFFAISGGRLHAAPVNDTRSAAITLPGQLPVAVTDSNNIGATMEAGESDLGGIAGASVWFRWTPLVSGWVEIHTIPADPARNLDTVLVLHEIGKGMLGFNDGLDAANLHPSRLAFQATAGTTCEIGVYGYSYSVGAFDQHDFEFRINAIPDPPVKVSWVSFSPGTAVLDGQLEGGNDCNVVSEVAIISAQPLFPAGSPDGSVSVISHDKSVVESGGFNSGSKFWGTDNDGRYAAAFGLLPSAPTGIWSVQIGIPDPADGTMLRWSSRGDDLVEDFYLMPASAGAKLRVASPAEGDSTAPVLSALTIPSTSAETLDEMEVTFRFVDGDTGSGFASAEIWLTPADGTQGYFVGMIDSSHRISGDVRAGDYRLSLQIPEGLPSGPYSWAVSVTDLMGNTSSYSSQGDSTVSEILMARTFTLAALTDLPLWRKRWFGISSPSGNAGDFADPDGDGTTNFFEFATGGHPLTAESAPASLERTDSGYVFRFRKGKQAANSNMQHIVEWTDSLGGSWRTDSLTTRKISEDAAAEVHEAEVTVPAGSRRFFRLRAVK